MFSENKLEFKNKKEAENPSKNYIQTCLLDENWENGASAKAIKEIVKEGQQVTFVSRKGDEDGIISNINERSKYSFNFYDCIGIVACGESRLSGKPNSFLAHLSGTEYFKERNTSIYDPERILKELQRRTSRLIESSKEKTTDIVIFGGFVDKKDRDRGVFGTLRAYKNTINFLRESFSEFKGLDPIILMGPRDHLIFDDRTDIYFDTLKRRLYVYRKGMDAELNTRLWSWKLSEADKLLEEIEKESKDKE
ncbi:MAG: hypothetical protein WC447_01165 [Candidatus Paceibacterota bacterium]|jgi:hypothetical protein